MEVTSLIHLKVCSKDERKSKKLAKYASVHDLRPLLQVVLIIKLPSHILLFKKADLCKITTEKAVSGSVTECNVWHTQAAGFCLVKCSVCRPSVVFLPCESCSRAPRSCWSFWRGQRCRATRVDMCEPRSGTPSSQGSCRRRSWTPPTQPPDKLTKHTAESETVSTMLPGAPLHSNTSFSHQCAELVVGLQEISIRD